MLNLLVVEDEDLLAKRMVQLVRAELPEANIACTKTISATVKWLFENGDPDLLFMDIELADGQCFEIFRQSKTKSPIIFTTAYDEYALKAFKLNSIDYLLKPIKEEELAAAIRKWKETKLIEKGQSQVVRIESLLQHFGMTAGATYRDRFLVRHGQKQLPVLVSEVCYLTSKNSVSYLVTKRKQKFFIDYTLDEVEEMLDPKRFFRVNRQFILANEIVSAVQPWFHGKLKLDIDVPMDEDVIVSREKAAAVREWLGA